MSLKRVPYQSGDVFCVPLLDGSFGYGRILLDLFRVRRQGVFDPRCALNAIYGSGLLVQLYRYTSTTPLTDVGKLGEAETFLDEFLAHDQILRGKHRLVGRLPVSPHEINFPEYVTTYGPSSGVWHFYYQKGGVVSELASGWRALLRGVIRGVDYDVALKLPRGGYGLGINPDVLLTQIQSPTGITDRASADLRVSPHRRRILRLAGFSSKMTYDQMATRTNKPLAKELLEIT